MASASTIARLERLVWVLIYSGMLCLALGIAIRQETSGGLAMMILGGVVAAVGVVLIFVRARLNKDV